MPEVRTDFVTRRRARLDAGRQGEGAAPPPPLTRSDVRVPTQFQPRALSPHETKTPGPSRPLPPSPRLPKQRVPFVPDESDQGPSPLPQIQVLLDHYRDVLEGLPDKEKHSSDDLLALMCPAWNSPAYQQLERLLERMAREAPDLRQTIRTRYERYHEVRVARCRKCGDHPASHIGRVHSHPPGRSVQLRPKITRVFGPFSTQKLFDSLAWLEARWEGAAVLPPAVAQIESERKLREAA